MAKEKKPPSGPRPATDIPAVGWTRYRVTWLGLNKLCASVPADPEIVKAWIEARKPRVQPPGGLSLDEINEEVLASLADEEERDSNILIFQRHEGLCTERAATVKAHLKDCARRLSARTGRIEGESAFSTKVINYVYQAPQPYWIPVLRPDGTPVTKHDSEMDRPVTTFRGTSLKRFEWIEPWRMDFGLQVWTTSGFPAVSQEDLEKLMLYGGVHGYGGERGNGEGKYVATITKEED
jgi:hypothetical protein